MRMQTTLFAPQSGKNQGGFSLITTLILLAVVTVLGVTASQIVLMAERSSRFDRDTQIAFQSAEAALLDASFDIQGPNTYVSQRMALFEDKNKVNFAPNCATLGVYRGMCLQAEEGQKPVWFQIDFTDVSANAKTVQFGEFTGRSFSAGSTGIRPELAPRYIIEVISDQRATASAEPRDVLYRITAMGFGPRKETQVVLQTIFKKV
jgi:type IV pilus assembly protein PilX